MARRGRYRPVFVATLIALIGLLRTPAIAPCGVAGPTSPTVPDPIDAKARYLFYLHGAWIEEHGLDAAHPEYGRYQYAEITRALGDRGFIVISEARLHAVDPAAYAQGVARQVTALLDSGVPPRHITVIGHSKGAWMVLLLASALHNPALQFVVMAGCGKPGAPAREGYDRFVATRAPSLQGRILSLYDRSDQLMATCDEAFARASPARIESREIVLDTDGDTACSTHRTSGGSIRSSRGQGATRDHRALCSSSRAPVASSQQRPLRSHGPGALTNCRTNPDQRVQCSCAMSPTMLQR